MYSIITKMEVDMSIEPKPVDFPSIDEAILAYIDMRKQLRAHMSEAKDKEDEMKAFLEKVSMWLREIGRAHV